MSTITFKNKTYRVDTEEFLSDFTDWDEDFARGMAAKVGIVGGLSDDHWTVIRFIRERVETAGRCPSVYETCRTNRLPLRDLERLFPTGYLRGACKVAGVTYKEGYLDQAVLEDFAERITAGAPEGKTYRIDVRGFLVDPSEWDQEFAMCKAYEMKVPKLTEKHWQIIRFLRQGFEKNNMVPTVYQTCVANEVDLEELQSLFPDGYHRCAVKLAGLRVR